MAEDELVRRILDEADMAARPGQYDRLVAIANEVAALREQYVVEEFIDTDGYPSMRVVKGEHVSENEWAANIRREVLADLRAKVEGLPCRTWVPPHATDCPGRPGKRGICTCGDSLRASDWMLRADVLALLEEVPRG